MLKSCDLVDTESADLMDVGAFTSGLLTGLREGVEAALIVAIICAYLARTGHARYFPRVFLGAGLAVLLSAVLGVGLYLTVGSFKEPYEQLFEAATLLVAAAVVTWMLFWMRRQAGSVKGELQAGVDRALNDGSVAALASLAFIAVVREGVETALFLTGQAASADQGAIWVLIGAVIGLAIAGLLGIGFYHGSRRLNLGSFFRWTGIALVFIAGGLVAKAIHELIEINVITIGTQTLVDLSAILPHEDGGGSVLGQFLHAVFGYTATPEVVTFVAWLTYVVVVLTLFLRPVKPIPRPATPAVTPAGG
jgi:high-affinity iron transporter